MPKTIATASNVFAACDRLDAANDRWNREDVRSEVGGGGWVVIDPLIQAWRALRPLRELAPTTPTELLHQVAASIEAHVSSFNEETAERLAASQTVFESTTAELAAKLTELEAELEQRNQALDEALAANEVLVSDQEALKTDLSGARAEQTRLASDNDRLAGQVARMDAEHKAIVKGLQAEAKEMATAHAQERAKLNEEQVAALADQRKELTESAEQAENRLMNLLDQERQEAKAAQSKLSGDLAKATKSIQSKRDSIVALETRVTELSRQNDKLGGELEEESQWASDLETQLIEQKSVTVAIEREFDAYKGERSGQEKCKKFRFAQNLTRLPLYNRVYRFPVRLDVSMV